MYKLPPLPYAYSALEPHIDAKTMEVHYTKHHATYVEKLNEALSKHPEIVEKPISDLIQGIKAIPGDIQTAVRNNGGGHSNHSLFWESMKPGGANQPNGKLADVIDGIYGNYDFLKAKFTECALGQFGSGWAWLAYTAGNLEIYSTPNQDSPLMERKLPLLGLDVWEHAYYLKYQNRRAEYIEAWWNLVNWDVVASRLS